MKKEWTWYSIATGSLAIQSRFVIHSNRNCFMARLFPKKCQDSIVSWFMLALNWWCCKGNCFFLFQAMKFSNRHGLARASNWLSLKIYCILSYITLYNALYIYISLHVKTCYTYVYIYTYNSLYELLIDPLKLFREPHFFPTWPRNTWICHCFWTHAWEKSSALWPGYVYTYLYRHVCTFFTHFFFWKWHHIKIPQHFNPLLLYESPPQRNIFFIWHISRPPIWHFFFILSYLTYILTVYLAFFLAFYLTHTLAF